MNVSGGPNMLDMLSLLGGMQGGPGPGQSGPGLGRSDLSSLAALAPLLQSFSGPGRSGPDIGALAALAPLLQSMAGQTAGKTKPQEAASQAADAERSAPPVIDVVPPPPEEQPQDERSQEAGRQETFPREAKAEETSAGHTPSGNSGRGSRKGGRGFSFDPALLSLLTNLGGSGRPRPAGEPPQEPPAPEPQEPPEEDFDPCAACPLDCPRRNPSLSFGQVQALAATFPAFI